MDQDLKRVYGVDLYVLDERLQVEEFVMPGQVELLLRRILT